MTTANGTISNNEHDATCDHLTGLCDFDNDDATTAERTLALMVNQPVSVVRASLNGPNGDAATARAVRASNPNPETCDACNDNQRRGIISTGNESHDCGDFDAPFEQDSDNGWDAFESRGGRAANDKLACDIQTIGDISFPESPRLGRQFGSIDDG